jgi:hypothetical protein
LAVRAKNLEEAQRLLSPQPLEFQTDAGPASETSDPTFYTELPQLHHGALRLPGPLERVRDRLLSGRTGTKVFLSGHVGSGKSTELNRMACSRDVVGTFSVVRLRFEEQEQAFLDSSQVLFRIANSLFDFAQSKGLLAGVERLKKHLQRVNQQVYGETGIQAGEGTVGLEINALFLKLKQDLKLSEKRRKAFREFAETEQSVLQDLLSSLADDIQNALARRQLPAKILLVVDDLDKVRGSEAQHDIFATNLNALLAPPFSIVYTLPTAVTFGESRADLRQSWEHLYPIGILKKVTTYDPDNAFEALHFPFFRNVIDRRVEPGLITDDALRSAAVHSGGVLRELFHLLAEGIRVARYNGLPTLDAVTMLEANRNVRLKESAGLYDADFEVLEHVHQTHTLPSEAARPYLDQSRVLECYNDAVWFEANPILWPLLEKRQQAGAGA